MNFLKGRMLYKNSLSSEEDIAEYHLEGDACITFPRGIMRMENAYERDKEKGLHANFVLWCDRNFPDDIAVSWNFKPLTDAGLAMFWIASRGRNGEDIFSPQLEQRDGDYSQYNHGDINALHASYYRRNPAEIGFRTCNLRKSHGHNLVCLAGDPLPDAKYATKPYRIEVTKSGQHFRFSIDDIEIYHWVDDGVRYGPILQDGKIGFRQMAGLIAEYSDLTVHKIKDVKNE